MGGNMYEKLLSQLCHISRRIDLSFVHCFQVLTLSSAFNISHSCEWLGMQTPLHVVLFQHPWLGGAVGAV